jgi:hypothetical protein
MIFQVRLRVEKRGADAVATNFKKFLRSASKWRSARSGKQSVCGRRFCENRRGKRPKKLRTGRRNFRRRLISGIKQRRVGVALGVEGGLMMMTIWPVTMIVMRKVARRRIVRLTIISIWDIGIYIIYAGDDDDSEEEEEKNEHLLTNIIFHIK